MHVHCTCVCICHGKGRANGENVGNIIKATYSTYAVEYDCISDNLKSAPLAPLTWLRGLHQTVGGLFQMFLIEI